MHEMYTPRDICLFLAYYSKSCFSYFVRSPVEISVTLAQLGVMCSQFCVQGYKCIYKTIKPALVK